MRRTCAHHPQPWEFRTQELQFCSRQHASKRLCCTWLVRRGVKSSGMTMGETRRAEGGMEAVVGTVMVTVVMVWELVYWLDCVGVGCHPRGDQGCEGRPRETRVGETKLGVADQLACTEQRVPRSWHAARRLNLIDFIYLTAAKAASLPSIAPPGPHPWTRQRSGRSQPCFTYLYTPCTRRSSLQGGSAKTQCLPLLHGRQPATAETSDLYTARLVALYGETPNAFLFFPSL